MLRSSLIDQKLSFCDTRVMFLDSQKRFFHSRKTTEISRERDFRESYFSLSATTADNPRPRRETRYANNARRSRSPPRSGPALVPGRRSQVLVSPSPRGGGPEKRRDEQVDRTPRPRAAARLE